MTTQLEKVARAIGAHRGDYSEAGWLGPSTHAAALDDACAAVEALMEPSEAMLCPSTPIEYTMPEGEAALMIDTPTRYGVWKSMIAIILNEEQPK
jgi:hypothetical protein